MAAEAVTYGVKPPARTLQAVPASSSGGESQWLVGTTALREENELRVLQYDTARDALVTVASWAHPPEVWDAAACPGQPDRLATVHCRVGAWGATVWRADPGSPELEPLAQLPHDGTIRRALWSPHQPNKLLTVEESALRLWDLAAPPPQQQQSWAPAQPEAAAAPAAGQAQPQPFWTAALHPKDARLALAAAGGGVQLWDAAALQQQQPQQRQQPVAVLPCAHGGATVRDVSWAPGNEHRFVSGGDDGKLRLWDTRLLARPEALLELSGHTHWVWRCCFSPHHDQLLLSSSTDTTVALWFTPQLAKLKEADAARQAAGGGGRQQGGAAGRQEAADGRAATYDEHEDSVYGLAWSSVDPWLFASMSYDGRLVANRVPKSTKYKVLI